MTQLPFIIGLIIGAVIVKLFDTVDYRRLCIDRDRWRRKCEVAERKVAWFRMVAIDGPTHPHPHLCGKPGNGTYEQCCECWDKAAAEAVGEERDD